jgi:phosphoribosylformylglycinamidine synthase
LGGGAPQYERSFTKPQYLSKIESFNQDAIAVPVDLMNVAKQLVAIPNIASKKWIFDQYDSMVGTGTTNTNEPSDAAVVIAKPTNKALALTTDCNSRYVFADPYKGAMIAVAEAARNIVCSGGQPLGVTNCLNFGNPYDPEVYYQFTEAIKGMGAACVKFDTPVTGGNVSFYNQSPDGPVYPTPTIGMVGLMNSVEDKMTMYFKNAGDEIYIIGHLRNDIGSSEYLHKIVGEEFSTAPYFNLDEEFEMQQFVLKLIENKTIVSAHDISEGGLIVTLLESSFNKNLGFSVSQENKEIRKDAFWFGEAQGRVVVSVNEKMKADFEKIVSQAKVPVTKIGNVNEVSVNVDSQAWGSVAEWKAVYDNAIAALLKAEVN